MSFQRKPSKQLMISIFDYYGKRICYAVTYHEITEEVSDYVKTLINIHGEAVGRVVVSNGLYLQDCQNRHDATLTDFSTKCADNAAAIMSGHK